jgi:hypothetical protein
MRRMEGSSVGVTKCPKCAADVAAGETFCTACGASVVAGIERPMDMPPEVIGLGLERDVRIGRARKWLMAISIITLVSGFIFYAIGKDQVEKQIRDTEIQIAHLDSETRDALVKENTGMATWDDVKAHDRGQVNLLLFVNIGLAIVYLGLWFWAKRNALAATVTALLLFITVIFVNAAYEPKTLGQGIIVKIFFIAALAKAISAAQEERKIQAQMPRASVV